MYIRCVPGIVALILAACVVAGCDDDTPPLILALEDPPAVNPADVFFEVSVVPRDENPLLVDVLVTASSPAAWQSLPESQAAGSWERLIVIRPLDEAAEVLANELAGKRKRSRSAPLAGEYSISQNKLQFRLFDPLEPGVAYRIEFNRSQIPGFDAGSTFGGSSGPPLRPIVSWYIASQDGTPSSPLPQGDRSELPLHGS